MKRIHNYEIYPKNLVAQNVVYQNMSNHYRRLYSAKSRVDSGPPWSCKISQASAYTPNSKTKQGCWVSKSNMGVCKDKQKLLHQQQRSTTTSTDNSKTTSVDSVQRNKTKPVVQQNVPMFQPKILNVGVESKVQSLRVYHPPRRRFKSRETERKVPDLSESKCEKVKGDWVQPTSPADNVITIHSKPSSSDSAYTEEGEAVWSGGESRGTTPIQLSTPPHPVLDWTSTHRSSRSDDMLYVKFLRGITDEVLRKGIFTNRALKNIFQEHINANKHHLNVRRMEEEVDKLCIQLGIPKEDYLNDIEYGLGSTMDWKENYDDNVSYSNSSTSIADSELLEALEQLDISTAFKEDVALSLGINKNTKHIHKSRTRISKDIKFSTSLEANQTESSDTLHNKQLHLHLPLSDSNTEDLSECSVSQMSMNVGVICQN